MLPSDSDADSDTDSDADSARMLAWVLRVTAGGGAPRPASRHPRGRGRRGPARRSPGLASRLDPAVLAERAPAALLAMRLLPAVHADRGPAALLASPLLDPAMLTGEDFASARLFCCLVTILADWVILGGRRVSTGPLLLENRL